MRTKQLMLKVNRSYLCISLLLYWMGPLGKGRKRGRHRTWFGRATHELLRGQQVFGPLRNTIWESVYFFKKGFVKNVDWLVLSIILIRILAILLYVESHDANSLLAIQLAVTNHGVCFRHDNVHRAIVEVSRQVFGWRLKWSPRSVRAMISNLQNKNKNK